jgi:pyruvate,water dikinase
MKDLSLIEPTCACELPLSVSLDGGSDARVVGGKAFHLGCMRRMGLPVPPGFVVTAAAFESFLDANGLRPHIANQLTSLDLAATESFRLAGSRIRDAILRAELPSAVREALSRCQADLARRGPLIVRSSAVGEDGPHASFAGQLDSVWPVSAVEQLESALLACWASYWSARSLFYQRSGRGRLAGMGVIVQPLVPSAVSGVLFTRCPDDNHSAGQRMHGEYCYGYGELLVSGRLNPGRFFINRGTLRGEMEARPKQAESEKLDTLVRERLTVLGRGGLHLEEAFGRPQDIEWTITESGELFFVQSRAITAPLSSVRAPHRTRARPELESQPRRVHWSNANVNENFPGPISPLLYSIAATGYYHYFRNLALGFGISLRRITAMERPLRQIIGVHGARMYYNLTSIHTVLREVPGGNRLVDFFNLFVGVHELEGKGATSPNAPGRGGRRWGTPFELAAVAVKTLWQYLLIRRRVGRFERVVSEFIESTRPEQLQDRSTAELLAAFRGFLHIRCRRWNDAALADAAAMIGYGLLKIFLERAFPEARQAGLHNVLLKGLPELVSGIPAVKLWHLSRLIRADARLEELLASGSDEEFLGRVQTDDSFAGFRTEYHQFLAQWGFRFSGELMLTVPGLDERPAALLELLRAYCRMTDESPVEALRRQADERQSLTRELCAELRRGRRLRGAPRWARPLLLRTLLRWTQTAIQLRERARLKQAQLYNRCRRIVLAVGDRLVERAELERREDVFFFTWQELDALLCGAAMFPYRLKEMVAIRRRHHHELSGMVLPDSFSLGEDEYVQWQGERGGTRRAPANRQPGAKLTGLSACGGQITGPANLLNDLSEAGRLRPGAVLVTRQTDPGWGPVFFLVKGLVLERGGMLSHGAILAREYGIPAVVGVHEATLRITQGQTVRVDGDQGHVDLLD